MKKITTIILSVLLIALTFVSCDNATKAVQDELVEVTLSTQATGRSLTVSNPLEALSEVNWFYKATKVSETQFNYGAKAEETSIDLYPAKGEKQKLTLSQGKWVFELFGRNSSGTLLYRGETDEVLILRSNGLNQITVEVSPYTDALGQISFNGVKLVKANGDQFTPNYLNVTGPDGYTHTDSSFNGTKPLTKLKAGQYTVTVAWRGTETGDNPYTTDVVENGYEVVIASETIVVTVYGGRTTTIEGNISEETGSGTINGNIEIKTEATQQKTVVADTPTTFTVNVAPANSEYLSKVENSTVTFAENSLTSDQTAILKVEVKDISSSIVDSSFTVVNGNSAVAGISLTLTVGETTQTGDFGNAVIETYIAKGLSNVQVMYNGSLHKAITSVLSTDESKPASNYYESDTGKLVFLTTHFSEYYVVADEVVALNTTTNTAYKSLRDAFAAVQNNENLVILNNCETGSDFTTTNPLRFTASNVTLDLNDKTITVNNNFSFLINGNNAVVKNGKIISAKNSGKETGINSYVLVLNNCNNAILENLTLIGGLSIGGSNGETPNAGAAIDAIVRNCNITSGDWYAVCSQMNSTAIIENGIFKVNDIPSQYQGVLQANFQGDDGPAGQIEIRGGNFTGNISANNVNYLSIKGGTFSSNPSAYVINGYGCRLTSNGYFEVVTARDAGYKIGPALPVGPIVSGNVWTVNPSNAQYTLDGAYGSIDGKTINFSAGEYSEKLIIGRPTKYSGSNTVYKHGSHNGTALSYGDFIEYKSQGGYTEYCYYNRSISNVTFTANSDVVLPGFTVDGGAHVYGTQESPIYDYVRDKGETCSDTNDGYYTYCELRNISFKGLTFNGRTNIETSAEKTIFDGFTFENCTFNIYNTFADNQALRFYTGIQEESENSNIKNLVVKKSNFNNCYQGVYANGVYGVTVTECNFNTTTHNAIAIQDNTTLSHGPVVITNNTFKNIGDRIIRFGNVGADTQITIQNNTATDSGNTSGEVIKAESLANGITYNISGNNWGEGKTVANTELEDRQTGNN